MIHRTHLVVLGALLASLWLLSAVVYPALPQTVPMHWGIRGNVDAFGSRLWAVTLLPGVATAVVLLMLVLARLGPCRRDLDRSTTTMGRVLMATTLALGGIHVLLLLAGLGYRVPMASGIYVITGLLFAALGNWMGKVRRNPWLGIRTPWTLSDDVVWERTHRIGGRLMVGFGVAMVVVGVTTPPIVGLTVLLAGLGTLAVWSMVYSFRVHRAVRGARGAG